VRIIRTAQRKAITAVLIALIALLCVPSGFNSSVRKGNSETLQPRLASRSFVLADLDGDSRADSVRLRSSGTNKIVDVRFASLRTGKFSFLTTSRELGRLIGKDIDGDGDLDLIWRGTGEEKSAVVLINDGRGNFAAAGDNTPYAAEIHAIASDSDPSSHPFFQAASHFHSLVSSPFSNSAGPSSSWLIRITNVTASFPGFDRSTYQSPFTGALHKRGPPRILS